MSAAPARGRFLGAVLALLVAALAGYELAVRLSLEAAVARGDAAAVVEAAERSPLDAYAHREAARVQGPSAEERRRARAYLESALYARPKDAASLRLYAAELDAAGDVDRAADLFVRAVAMATDDTDSALSIADERLERARSRAGVASLAASRAARLEGAGQKEPAAEERARAEEALRAARLALETVVRVREALAKDALGAGMVEDRAATARTLLADLPRPP